MFEFKFQDSVTEYEGYEEPPGEVPGLPEITAYEPDKWRYDRLVSTFGTASGTVRLMSNRYRSLWNGAIRALYDDKGALVINWRDKTSRIIFEGVIAGAWNSHGEPLHAHILDLQAAAVGKQPPRTGR